jgi:hypothetical protein
MIDMIMLYLQGNGNAGNIDSYRFLYSSSWKNRLFQQQNTA